MRLGCWRVLGVDGVLSVGGILGLSGLLAGACAVPAGSGPKVEEPPSGSVEAGEPVDEPADEPVAAEESAEQSPDEDAAAEASEEPPEEDATDLATAMVDRECEALCVRADEVCTADEARRCRNQCKKYSERSKGCEVPYKAALKCQATAEKSELCANVVSPKCVEPFQRIKRCEQGLEEQAAKEKQKALPAGWKPITDNQLHFTIALPASAALDKDAERRTWRAQDGSIEYVVAQLSSPGKAVTSQVLLKLALEFVGFSCQKNLKLHGQFEVKDEVAIRVDTQCKDGSEWHGMLRARPDQAIATAFHGPLQGGVLEPFIYSYKRLK